MISPEDTIAAVATPLGEGGLGVIRISGTKAIEIVSKLFKPAKPIDLNQVPSHTCHFGMVASPPAPLPSGEGGPDAKRRGTGEAQAVDQVVVTLFRAPHSYTAEDVVEISAHGSPFTLHKILNLCLQKGARLAGPGEFTERAFLNGKMDLTQAEAVAELIQAKTDKAQTAALAQMQGHLARKIRALRERLLPLLAHVEVGLDHSDEDHDFISRDHLITTCRDIQKDVELLLQGSRVGKILREGFRVALLGRPNVGKSSLMNALLKEERAIVTPIPGTTRDTLEESVNWNGIPVVLTDTAGLRQDTQDPIEHLGIGRTRKTLEQADLVLAIFDGSEPWTHEDDEILNACSTKPRIGVMNKCDLASKWIAQKPLLPSRETGASANSYSAPVLQVVSGKVGMRDGGVTCLERENHPSPSSSPLKGEELIHVSAKTGEGLETLIQKIADLALGEKAQTSEAQWLLNARHHAALERAQEALSQAAEAARTETFEECVALELQTALGALGEIIGETTTEELLDQIFSTFCIGK